jgi:ribosomal RNA-processing protein 9
MYLCPRSLACASERVLPRPHPHPSVRPVARLGAQASGAGDGAVRLWAVKPSKAGGAGALACLGALPQRGFVNGLAFARSGRFLAAAVGQEQRMGRWCRDAGARNGLALHRLHLE